MFRGYHMPCQLVSMNSIIDYWIIWLFSLVLYRCVDNTFCCSKVKYSVLLKVTEFFAAVPSTSPWENHAFLSDKPFSKPLKKRERKIRAELQFGCTWYVTVVKNIGTLCKLHQGAQLPPIIIIALRNNPNMQYHAIY